jgi:hypothetical protein
MADQPDALGRIDLSFLAVARHPVAIEVAQMRVHGLGADELPSARGAALLVEGASAAPD